jgi:nucleotide-binding universal stress UspA family protein
MDARERDHMTRVLVAVDETDDSVEAARSAHRLFGDDAEYLAVNVARPAPLADDGVVHPIGGPAAAWGFVWPVRPTASPVGPGFEPAEPHASSSPTPLEHAEAVASTQAARAGVGGHPIGEVGDPAEAILAAADAHAVDVIVVGSHAHGWLSRLFGRSVSSAVVRDSTIPVLVVR